MKCPRCEFENIPGQNACIKCGSVLKTGSIQIDVHPPRMSSWKKPFRSIVRRMREARMLPADRASFHPPVWLKRFRNDAIVGLLLSIVPGFAHLVAHRFKEIRWYFISWLVLFLSGLLLYPGTTGFVLLGLAVGVHAIIGLRYGLLSDLEDFVARVVAAVMVMAVLAFVYRSILGMLFSGLIGAYTPLSIPYYGIRAGDYLLAARYSVSPVQLSRGYVILIHPYTVTGGIHGNRAQSNAGIMVGEIIGLPGEHVDIDNNAFVVDGKTLDPAQYVVPQWLRNRKTSVNVDSDRYFVSFEYRVYAHGLQLTDGYISSACTVRASDIEGRAFMVWLPLWRRGFLR